MEGWLGATVKLLLLSMRCRRLGWALLRIVQLRVDVCARWTESLLHSQQVYLMHGCMHFTPRKPRTEKLWAFHAGARAGRGAASVVKSWLTGGANLSCPEDRPKLNQEAMPWVPDRLRCHGEARS